MNMADNSVNKWKGCAAVTNTWMAFTHQRMNFSEQIRKAQLADIESQLNDLARQGDDAKKYVDSVNHHFQLYLETETKSLTNLLNEAKMQVKAAQKKEAQLQLELEEIESEVEAQSPKVEGLKAASTADDILKKLNERRLAFLKLSAFNQSDLQQHGNSFVSMWTHMRGAFRKHHHTFRLLWNASEEYLTNLEGTTTPKFDERGAINCIFAKYLEACVIEDQGSATNNMVARQKHWEKIVEHHCPKADADEVQQFTECLSYFEIIDEDGIVKEKQLEEIMMEKFKALHMDTEEIDEVESEKEQLKEQLKKAKNNSEDKHEMEKEITNLNKQMQQLKVKEAKIQTKIDSKAKKDARPLAKMISNVHQGVRAVYNSLELESGAPDFLQKVEDGVSMYTENTAPVLRAMIGAGRQAKSLPNKA
jgi:DNA repair exonuclease SbcCD ATPase subunit